MESLQQETPNPYWGSCSRLSNSHHFWRAKGTCILYKDSEWAHEIVPCRVLCPLHKYIALPSRIFTEAHFETCCVRSACRGCPVWRNHPAAPSSERRCPQREDAEGCVELQAHLAKSWSVCLAPIYGISIVCIHTTKLEAVSTAVVIGAWSNLVLSSAGILTVPRNSGEK